MNLFANETHEQVFAQFRQELPEYKQNDTEYTSALYVITGDAELFSKMKPYFSNAGFSYEEMFEEKDFSGGYLILAKLAVHLFNNGVDISPLDLTSTLDSNGFQLAMNAIYIRRYGINNK